MFKSYVVRAGVLMAAAFTPAMASLVQPAPAGQPGPVFIFFDWGKPDLRSDDQPLLDKAATEWAARPGARLILSGHSDRSGPSSSNLRSSRRRAETARDYLVAHGVAKGAISIEAYGEQRPIVETEDGVREIQNRRVEIRFVAPR